MFKKVYKTIATILTVASIISVAWFCISYAEVCCKNLTETPVYSNWNLFQLLVNMGQETIPFFGGQCATAYTCAPEQFESWQYLEMANIVKTRKYFLPEIATYVKIFAPVAGSWGDRFSRYLQFCHFLAFISWHDSCIGTFLKLPLY